MAKLELMKHTARRRVDGQKGGKGDGRVRQEKQQVIKFLIAHVLQITNFLSTLSLKLLWRCIWGTWLHPAPDNNVAEDL